MIVESVYLEIGILDHMHWINMNRTMLYHQFHKEKICLNGNLKQDNPPTKWKTETESMMKECYIDENEIKKANQIKAKLIMKNNK